MKSVCFTGHRNVKETAGLKNNLLEQLVKLIAEGADVFYAGGAVGWDMLCERAVFALQNAECERDSLKAKLRKVLDFIDSLKLTQKLHEFLRPRTRWARIGAFFLFIPKYYCKISKTVI